MWNLIAPAVTPIIDKLVGLIPDKNAREKAREELELELARAINQQALGQLEVNRTEAAHRSVFVAGWRPFIGWTCGIAILWAFVGQPVAAWYIAAFEPETIKTLPQVNTDHLFELVLAMLGMGGLRTYEKIKGATK